MGTFALPFTLTTQDLLLPASISGDIDKSYIPWTPDQGAGQSCYEFPTIGVREGTPKYSTLRECCEQHHSWQVESCCANGPGGCPDLGVRSLGERDLTSTQLGRKGDFAPQKWHWSLMTHQRCI